MQFDLIEFFSNPNSLPWNCFHLRSDVGRRDAFGIASLFWRSHRVLHVRLQPTRPVGSRLGMGRLLRQHPIRCQILPRICRRRRERTGHSLHDEPAQQRSRPSGKLPISHDYIVQCKELVIPTHRAHPNKSVKFVSARKVQGSLI